MGIPTSEPDVFIVWCYSPGGTGELQDVHMSQNAPQKWPKACLCFECPNDSKRCKTMLLFYWNHGLQTLSQEHTLITEQSSEEKAVWFYEWATLIPSPNKSHNSIWSSLRINLTPTLDHHKSIYPRIVRICSHKNKNHTLEMDSVYTDYN